MLMINNSFKTRPNNQKMMKLTVNSYKARLRRYSLGTELCVWDNSDSGQVVAPVLMYTDDDEGVLAAHMLHWHQWCWSHTGAPCDHWSCETVWSHVQKLVLAEERRMLPKIVLEDWSDLWPGSTWSWLQTHTCTLTSEVESVSGVLYQFLAAQLLSAGVWLLIVSVEWRSWRSCSRHRRM